MATMFSGGTLTWILCTAEVKWNKPKGNATLPTDLAESLTERSKVGSPLWNPPSSLWPRCETPFGPPS